MRASGVKYVDSLARFASVLATLIIGVAFAMVTSVYAAAPDKKLEVNAKEKIAKIEKLEKLDKLDSRARAFNRRVNFNNNRLNNVRFNNNRLNNLDNIRLNNLDNIRVNNLDNIRVNPFFINPFVGVDELLEED